MDAIIILLALGSVFVGLILLIVTKFRRKVVVEKPAVVARPVPVDREDVAGGVRRGARRRPRRMVREQPEEEIGLEDDDDREELDPDEFLTFDDKNMGKKKREKMEKKMERRKMREMEAEDRLEKKEREERLMEERRHEAELEELEEKKKEEEERLKKEEEEKRQHEEYLILKESFTVEEEGQEKAMSLDEAENLLQKFIDYIKQRKVVILEDLAAEFFMRTQDAIKRVQELQEEGRLTGVVDDRGKFIYISQDELDGFARFIRQRGRVSITELAEASNTLINLQPDIISLEQTVS